MACCAFNHEYTNSDLIFNDVRGSMPYPAPTRRHMDVEMAAHGHSVVEVKRSGAGGGPTCKIASSTGVSWRRRRK